MDLTLLYAIVAVGLSGFVIQRSKILTILIYLFAWTLMWTTHTADYNAYWGIYNSGFEFRDGGFKILCMAGHWLGLSFFEFFMSLGFITIGIYCWFTIRYARKNSLVAALWLLALSLLDLVQFRNFMGFAIVLCFIPCLFNPSRNKIILYCAGVLVAGTIHLTMIFYLVFVFMNKEWFSAKNLRKIIVPLVLLAVALVIGGSYYIDRAETMMTLYNRKTSDLTKWLILGLFVGNAAFVYFWSRRKVELNLDDNQMSIALSPGKVVVLFNIILIILYPISFQTLSIMRLYKYVAIINFVYIANHMASVTNWRLVPQTFVIGLYGLSYFILFLFINGMFYIKGVTKPIITTNIFWPEVISWFGF